VVAFQQPGGTAPRRAAYLRRLAAFPPTTRLTYRLGQLELEALREEWVAGGGDVR